jgi:hypothetical protein
VITVKGGNQFVAQIDQWVAKAKGRTQEFATEFIQDLNEAVVTATPIKTGFLRASWYAKIGSEPPPGSDGRGGVAALNMVASSVKLGDVYYARNGANYAWFVEYGTAAHIIEPKSKAALHWVKDGYDFFSTQVKHPGTPPRAFVRGTLGGVAFIAEAAARRVAIR